MISRFNLKITWPLDSNQRLPQSILSQWKEGEKYILENGLWTRLNDNTMVWIFFNCQQIHFMCATHKQHDLWSLILQSQSTQVMLRVSVGSSTSWHIEHGTSESSLFDSSSETSTQTLLFSSATENVNGKMDCFLLCCTFSTTISTFSRWSLLDGCEGAAQLINDDDLFITPKRFDFSAATSFFLLWQQVKQWEYYFILCKHLLLWCYINIFSSTMHTNQLGVELCLVVCSFNWTFAGHLGRKA